MSENNNNPKFLEYKEFIVSHPNYEGIPYKTKSDGSVSWVATGKSKLGQKRKQWWDNKRKELGIPKETKWPSKTSYHNHPTKEKPCSVCGNILSIDYVYLNKYAYNKLNETKGIHEEFNELSDIRDVVPDVIAELNDKGFEVLADIFNVPNEVPNKIDDYVKYIMETSPNSKKCGPGAMSNCPDRLDGYHTYNRCCRSVADKGRHEENLKRYSDDRRAYEHWADGNWKAANRLMAEYNNHGVSADHIGPISLGFCHSPHIFQPMTVSEQATKNNRMNLEDVNQLLQLEEEGYEIVSWHSKYIWNALKNYVDSDLSAKILSHYMRKNMHFVLTVFASFLLEENDEFLLFLLESNLKHSYFDYKFEGFDPVTGNYSNMVEKKLNTQNQKNNAERYVRIAFESLEKYIDKDNRKLDDTEILHPVSKIIEKAKLLAQEGQYNKSKEILKIAFSKKADYYKPMFLKDKEDRNY